jgi:hypothetical protein
LGEFSPKARLFTLGSFSKITQGAEKFGAILFQRIDYVLILTKNGLGYILGDLFTNSSGHPASDSV